MQIQRRKLSADYERRANPVSDVPSAGNERATTDFTESLFGRFGNNTDMGSPMVKIERLAMPLPLPVLGKRGFDDEESWDRDMDLDWDMRSPEQVGIEELDGLLDDF